MILHQPGLSGAPRSGSQIRNSIKSLKSSSFDQDFFYIEVILKDLTGQPNFRQLVKVRYVLTYIFSIVSPNRNFPAKKGKDYLEVAFFLFQATKSLFFCDVSIRSSISKQGRRNRPDRPDRGLAWIFKFIM